MRRHIESSGRSLRLHAVILAVATLLACSKSPNRAGSASRSSNEAIAIVERAMAGGGHGAYLLPMLLVRRSVIDLTAGDPEAAAVDGL